MFSIFKKDPTPKDSPSLFERLKNSVSKTRSEIAARVEGLFGGPSFDPNELRQLETALLAADLGVRTTRELIQGVKDRAAREPLRSADDLRAALKSQLLAILNAVPMTTNGGGTAAAAKPHVILMVGVNGTGKTTTIGKLAHRLHQQGHSVMLAAGDTFRAAAIEQLGVWAERTGSAIVQQKLGADPAAVVYDALSAAQARGSDTVIVDTAGRLQNKSNLMAELEKVKRTASRLVPGAPHDVLLVLDATTGQNGLTQAREFTAVAGVTGIVLTKLDGTARGGIVVPIMRELGLPVQYVGTGETAEDLVPFDAQTFVDGLFD